MKRVFIWLSIIGISVLVGVIVVSYRSSTQYTEARVRIGDSTLTALVADTVKKREQGLSGTQLLPDGRSMLFVFDEPTKSGFWMKEMAYPIDIIWIHSSGAILDLRHMVTPESFPAVFESDSYASYVLEVPGGWAVRHDVNVGNQVTIERG